MKHLFKIMIIGGALLIGMSSFAQGYYPVFSQKETKELIPRKQPLRIGFKVGFPNLAGGNVEYLTGILRNRVAFTVDYSTIKGEWLQDVLKEKEEDLNLKFSYLEGGLNIYFFNPGKGLYANVSYGMLDFEETRYDVASENDPNKLGTGKTDFSHDAFNLKIGAKLGGFLYFRPEVGYTFTPVPEAIDMLVSFDDNSRETHQTELKKEGSPFSPLFSGLIFNIGLGIAF